MPDTKTYTDTDELFDDFQQTLSEDPVIKEAKARILALKDEFRIIGQTTPMPGTEALFDPSYVSSKLDEAVDEFFYAGSEDWVEVDPGSGGYKIDMDQS